MSTIDYSATVTDRHDLATLAVELERHRDYRVLRPLQPRGPAPEPLAPGVRTAVVLDVETTGLDHETDAD